MMFPTDQPPGPPLVPPVDPSQVDHFRRQTYASYEKFLRRRLHDLDHERSELPSPNYTSVDAYLNSVEPRRERFKQMLGFWTEPETRQPPIGQDETVLLETDRFTASRFVYDAAPGLTTYAIRLVPKSSGRAPGLIIQHGYMGSPELAVGFAEGANVENGSYRSFGIRAAERGYHVIAPHHPSGYGTLSDNIDNALPDHDDQTVHYGKNRLHRYCVMGGGTLLGLDMFVTSRAVDILAADDRVDRARLGIYGLSRGGQTALFLPAMDQRIKASVCSAYFNDRLAKLIGPYSRTTYIDWFAEGQILPEQIRLFADADIVSLIVPRAFAIEAGVEDTAIDQEAAEQEYHRAKVHYERLGISNRIEFIPHAEGHVSATARAFDFLASFLTPEN